MIHIYSDGCVQDNTVRINKGGNGFIIVDPKLNFIMHTYVEASYNTTNNREEIKGILNALEYIKEWNPVGEEIVLYSDSEYCVKGCNKLHKLKKNLDLWEKVFNLLNEVNVEIKWIKGHQKESNGNTIIDELIQERLNLTPKY